MSTFDRRAENRYGATPANHDPRPRYIRLGRDDVGHTHYYCTATESIRVVDGRVQVDHFDVAERSVDDYVRFVRDQLDREWVDRDYVLPEEHPLAALSHEEA